MDPVLESLIRKLWEGVHVGGYEYEMMPLSEYEYDVEAAPKVGREPDFSKEEVAVLKELGLS